MRSRRNCLSGLLSEGTSLIFSYFCWWFPAWDFRFPGFSITNGQTEPNPTKTERENKREMTTPYITMVDMLHTAYDIEQAEKGYTTKGHHCVTADERGDAENTGKHNIDSKSKFTPSIGWKNYAEERKGRTNKKSESVYECNTLNYDALWWSYLAFSLFLRICVDRHSCSLIIACFVKSSSSFNLLDSPPLLFIICHWTIGVSLLYGELLPEGLSM